MTRGEFAEQKFMEGYTCSQAVCLAFLKDMDADEKTLLAAAYPMGGGMGRLRLTCGAVTGAVMCLGLFFPEKSKSELYALVQEFAGKFKQKNGSVICGELLSGKGIQADNSLRVEARTEEYYRKRPCLLLIKDAADILEEMLTAHGKL